VNVKAYCHTFAQKIWLDRHGMLYELRKPASFVEVSILQAQLHEFLSRYPGFEARGQNYIVELTPYGVYGRYQLPNRITVNTQRRPEDIAKTILHEVVHLRLEAEVKRKKLTYRQKEDLVESEYARLMAKATEKRMGGF